MSEDIPVYNQEEFWKVCKEAKPDLTREEFDYRWNSFVTIANLMGLWRKA